MTTAVQSIASNASQAIYAGLNGKSSASGASDAEKSQDRFLKLLVTQLKNQDPLNPMDNAQMTTQLAQISTVDGIEKVNATLQKLIDGSNENQSMQAAGLVGHGVLVPGAGLALQGGMAIGGVELAEAADRVTVSIKDSSGLVVKTLDLGALAAGSRGFNWDGKADSGAQAADGAYSVSIKAVRGGSDVTAKALELGVVSSVARTSQGVSLNVGALGMFKISDVREIL
jgi:flagellar basal-body rod modification protein FlgD